MTKYAYQNIGLDLGVNWRSGIKPGNKFDISSNVVAWWSLSDSISEGTVSATNLNGDFSESRGEQKTLKFENTAILTVGTDATKDNLNDNTLALTDSSGNTTIFVIKGAQAAALSGVNIGLNDAANEDAISDALIAGINAHAIKITASDGSGSAGDTAAHEIILTHDVEGTLTNISGGNMAETNALVAELSVSSSRSGCASDIPSKNLATNAPKFGNHQKAAITDNSFNFTSGTKDKAFSVSFWAKASGANAGARFVILKGVSAAAYEYKIGFNSKAPRIALRDGSGNEIQTNFANASAALSETQWNHYVFTYDGLPSTSRNGIVLYVNGEFTPATETNNGSYTFRPYALTKLLVGDASGNFNGWISNLAFFNTVINKDTAAALYNAKDGIYKEARNYDKKGSSTLIEEGGSMDPFREGVSIRNGRDIATTARPKMTTGFQMRFTTGPGSKPGRRSSTTLTCYDVLDVGIQISIISTDGTKKTYLGITEGHGSIDNGDIIKAGDNPGGGVLSSGDPRIGMVALHVGSNASDAALMIEQAINSINGNNQGQINKKIEVVRKDGNVFLTQVLPGSKGNTSIVILGGIGATVVDQSLTPGKLYQIKTVGNTDFKLLGAKINKVGHRFIATRAALANSYTGDAEEVRIGIKDSVDSFTGGTDQQKSNSTTLFDDTRAPMSIRSSVASTRIIFANSREIDTGNFVIGQTYTITVVGNTDFKQIGATENIVGTTFTATGTGEETKAEAKINVPAGDALHGLTAGQKITLKDSEGTIVDYFISDTGNGDAGVGHVAHLGAVANGATLDDGITAVRTAGSAKGIAVSFNLAAALPGGTSQAEFLGLLRAAILHGNGHDGKILVDAAPAEGAGNKTLVLRQQIGGVLGNTRIVSSLTNVTFENFITGKAFTSRPDSGVVLKIKSSDGTEIEYKGVTSNAAGDKPNGHLSADGVAIFKIDVKPLSKNLEEAINVAHRGKINVTRSDYTLALVQNQVGHLGNTTVKIHKDKSGIFTVPKGEITARPWILENVRVASTSNLTIADINNGDRIDGVSIETNDRILLKDQTTASENGIYVVAASAGNTLRALDMPTGFHANETFVSVDSGNTNANTGFFCTSPEASDTVGTHSLVFSKGSFGAFVNGAGSFSTDITGSHYHGVLDTTHRTKGVRQEIFNHEIEQSDFGVFEGGYTGRHQDGTPFSESSFVQSTELLNPHTYVRTSPIIQPVQIETGKRYTILKLSYSGDLNNAYPEPNGSPNASVTNAELGVASAADAAGISFVAAANGSNTSQANDGLTKLQEVPLVYDRHLKPMIYSTPDSLYNASYVYEKEARVDVFERTVGLRSTILDLRDFQKDSSRRPKRFIKSGSMTTPVRSRGIGAESNCIQCVDVRYHDIREASLPFYELNLDGDLSTRGKKIASLPDANGNPVVTETGTSLRHLGVNRLEKIMSQSSGARKTNLPGWAAPISLENIVSGSWYQTYQAGENGSYHWSPNNVGSPNDSVGTVFQATMSKPPLSTYLVTPFSHRGERGQTGSEPKNNKEPYGTFMESTVDTFYGTPGAHGRPSGQSFGVRNRTHSADRPFHERTKEDLVVKSLRQNNIVESKASMSGSIKLDFPPKLTDYSKFDVREPMGHDVDSVYTDQKSLYAFYNLDYQTAASLDLELTDLSGNNHHMRAQIEEGGEPSDIPLHSGLNPGWGLKGSKTFAVPGQMLTTKINDATSFRFTTSDGSGNPESDKPFTIMAWVRPTVVNTTAYIVAKGDYHGNDPHILEWALYRDSQKFAFELYGYQGGNIKIDSGNVASANTWYQVIVTYSGNGANTGLNIYVNGQKINSPTRAGNYTGVQAHRHSSVRISLGNAIDTQDASTGEAGGTTSGAGSRFFEGQIASVAVWSKELSEVSSKGLYHYQIQGNFDINLPGKNYSKPMRKSYTFIDGRKEIMPGITDIETSGQIIRVGNIVGGKEVRRGDSRIGNIAALVESTPIPGISMLPSLMKVLEGSINSATGHNEGVKDYAVSMIYDNVSAATDLKLTFNYDGAGNTQDTLHNVKITIVATDGTSRTYIGVKNTWSSPANGDILEIGDNPDGAGALESGDIRIGMIAFRATASTSYGAADAIHELATAIESANGHLGKINVIRISWDGNGPGHDLDPKEGHIRLIQVVGGEEGNKAVTVADDGSSLVTASSFSGGSDGLVLSRHGIVPEFIHPVTSSIPTIEIKETTTTNTDMVAASRMLYMTASSVHESGLTGYNHAQGGFFTDPHGSRRDSIAYLGLKRG